MLCLGCEVADVGCMSVIMGMEVDVDGTDVEVDGEGVEAEGAGVGEEGVGVMVTSSRDVSLASRIMRSNDMLVPPLSKITSWDLRKHPEGQCMRR